MSKKKIFFIIFVLLQILIITQNSYSYNVEVENIKYQQKVVKGDIQNISFDLYNHENINLKNYSLELFYSNIESVFDINIKLNKTENRKFIYEGNEINYEIFAKKIDDKFSINITSNGISQKVSLNIGEIVRLSDDSCLNFRYYFEEENEVELKYYKNCNYFIKKIDEINSNSKEEIYFDFQVGKIDDFCFAIKLKENNIFKKSINRVFEVRKRLLDFDIDILNDLFKINEENMLNFSLINTGSDKSIDTKLEMYALEKYEDIYLGSDKTKVADFEGNIFEVKYNYNEKINLTVKQNNKELICGNFEEGDLLDLENDFKLYIVRVNDFDSLELYIFKDKKEYLFDIGELDLDQEKKIQVKLQKIQAKEHKFLFYLKSGNYSKSFLKYLTFKDKKDITVNFDNNKYFLKNKKQNISIEVENYGYENISEFDLELSFFKKNLTHNLEILKDNVVEVNGRNHIIKLEIIDEYSKAKLEVIQFGTKKELEVLEKRIYEISPGNYIRIENIGKKTLDFQTGIKSKKNYEFKNLNLENYDEKEINLEYNFSNYYDYMQVNVFIKDETIVDNNFDYQEIEVAEKEGRIEISGFKEDSVYIGDNLTYQIKVSNTGIVDLNNSKLVGYKLSVIKFFSIGNISKKYKYNNVEISNIKRENNVFSFDYKKDDKIQKVEFNETIRFIELDDEVLIIDNYESLDIKKYNVAIGLFKKIEKKEHNIDFIEKSSKKYVSMSFEMKNLGEKSFLFFAENNKENIKSNFFKDYVNVLNKKPKIDFEFLNKGQKLELKNPIKLSYKIRNIGQAPGENINISIYKLLNYSKHYDIRKDNLSNISFSGINFNFNFSKYEEDESYNLRVKYYNNKTKEIRYNSIEGGEYYKVMDVDDNIKLRLGKYDFAILKVEKIKDEKINKINKGDFVENFLEVNENQEGSRKYLASIKYYFNLELKENHGITNYVILNKTHPYSYIDYSSRYDSDYLVDMRLVKRKENITIKNIIENVGINNATINLTFDLIYPKGDKFAFLKSGEINYDLKKFENQYIFKLKLGENKIKYNGEEISVKFKLKSDYYYDIESEFIRKNKDTQKITSLNSYFYYDDFVAKISNENDNFYLVIYEINKNYYKKNIKIQNKKKYEEDINLQLNKTGVYKIIMYDINDKNLFSYNKMRNVKKRISYLNNFICVYDTTKDLNFNGVYDDCESDFDYNNIDDRVKIEESNNGESSSGGSDSSSNSNSGSSNDITFFHSSQKKDIKKDVNSNEKKINKESDFIIKKKEQKIVLEENELIHLKSNKLKQDIKVIEVNDNEVVLDIGNGKKVLVKKNYKTKIDIDNDGNLDFEFEISSINSKNAVLNVLDLSEDKVEIVKQTQENIPEEIIKDTNYNFIIYILLGIALAGIITTIFVLRQKKEISVKKEDEVIYNFIKKAKLQGLTNELLKTKLIEVGWKEEKIDYIFKKYFK